MARAAPRRRWSRPREGDLYQPHGGRGTVGVRAPEEGRLHLAWPPAPSQGAARRLIVTADDFGLAPELNRGIVESHLRGVVACASLLVNAPASEQAVELSRRYPDLEVGLHLSVVEGFSLRGRPSTLTDSLAYLDGRLCLHRHWRTFVARYLTARIDLAELEEELELQIARFLTFYPSIPFLNTTQHLHMLPGVFDVVLRLAERFGIRAMRILRPAESFALLARRRVSSALLGALGHRARLRLQGRSIASPDFCLGFRHSGNLTSDRLGRLVRQLPAGTTEMVSHPGFECRSLREELPWGYRDFLWQQELEALTSPATWRLLAEEGIELIRFSQLSGAPALC